MSTNEYLDALLSVIPHHSLPPEIATHGYQKFLDAALRLATGGPARPDDASHLRDAWPEIQPSVQRALHALHTPTTSSHLTKRRRSSSPQQRPSTSSSTLHKKPKQDSQKGGGKDDEDGEDATDLPQLTVHALSATAPVRHKVDITFHARTLRLAHGGTGASVTRCERSALTRAFLLPTRARSSGTLQWTLLLLAGDKPPPPTPRGASNREGKSRADSGAGATVRFELACSVPESGAPPRITAHSSSSYPSSLRPSTTHQALLTLLSATIITPNDNDRLGLVLTSVERGAPLAGITAFRGVRETSLWFFDAGILTDARPAEFWALADLAPGEAGVRVRTATGRTCSVVLTRRASVGANSSEQDDGEEEEGEETEFQMIDGKERERILEWVRRHRDAFGIRDDAAAEAGAGSETDAQRVEEVDGGEGNGKVVGGDSDSDSDFETASSTSDGGSPSGTSSSTASGDSDSASEADQEDDDDDEEEDEDEEKEGSRQNVSQRVVKNNVESEDDEEVVDLDPKHHPLLRAMPNLKMSRAAVDAAVGLVMDDLVGQTSGGPGPPLASAQDDGEDEEDELEE
ncbi:hypothetical protein BGW80DRAFT_148615 [Lactifluus volemus]|nr:hypothetical protein BGW80DRAFT_148615 [Lactifluus volemus]